MSKVGETYDEAMFSKAMDFASDAIPAVGLLAIGMAGPAAISNMAVHGLSATDAVSRKMHMASQIQGAGNLVRKLEDAVPGIREDFHEVVRPLMAAERKQLMVQNDPKLLHFAQDFATVPPEWMDALQDHLDGRHVDIPGGVVSGKTWEQFRDEALDLGSESTAMLNASRTKHGEETVDEMGPLHPSATASMGTSGLVTRHFSELGAATRNTKDILAGIKAKGFDDIETLKSDLSEAYTHHADWTPEGYVVPLKEFRYLAGTEQTTGKYNAPVLVMGGKVYLLNPDGTPVRTPAEFREWVGDEATRFTGNLDVFGNVDDAAPNSTSGYHRKLPYLRSAHKATFNDLMNEIVSRRMEAAALDAHPVGYEAKIQEFRRKLDPIDTKEARKLKQYLGDVGSKSAENFVGRLYQQRGRLPSGQSGNLGRLTQAWTPFAYKMQLGITPTPGAAQQAQAFAQTAAYQFGDPGWAGGLIRKYAKNLVGETAALFKPNARSRLRIGASKHMDPTGIISPMEKGTAMIELSIKDDAERIMGNALRKGNPEFLETAYTPEELARLESRMREDGTVDLSDPEDMELAQSVVARYLEGHNGLDLATSKPAFMQGGTAKALGMYMGTPAVVTKAVSDLYRPGGLFHTGNKFQDFRGRAHVAAALTGQLLGANLVRSSAVAKALALLSAGAYLPAVSSAYAAANQFETQAEATNRQRLDLLTEAAKRLATLDGDPAELGAQFGNLSMALFSGSVPLKLTGANDFVDRLAGSIDRNAMRYGGRGAPKEEGALGTLTSAADLVPAFSAPLSLYKDIASMTDMRKLPAEGRWESILSRDLSKIPFIRDYSPFLPGTRMKLNIGATDVKSGGASFNATKF